MIVVDGVSLLGMVAVPPDARGIVVFSHGCGSSRLSPRNRQVARELYDAGFATMLFDLLASDEECQHAHEFDVVMLAGRLGYVTDWAHSQPGLTELPIGYFGASTGAAAAMWAAGEPGTKIAAIVSRGGRPDLATDRLSLVDAPTMLIVGGDDQVVLDLNRRAQATMNCETCLAVIPGASHLFDEPGALESVGKLARDWFSAHLGSSIQHRVGSVC